MSNLVKVVFGKEQVSKLDAGLALSDEETKEFVKEFLFESEEEKRAFLMGLEESNGWQEYQIVDHSTELNSFAVIDYSYIKPNISIEVTQISNGSITKLLYVYNYKGTDYYVFDSLQHLMGHLDGKDVSYQHCTSEVQLEGYLATVNI